MCIHFNVWDCIQPANIPFHYPWKTISSMYASFIPFTWFDIGIGYSLDSRKTTSGEKIYFLFLFPDFMNWAPIKLLEFLTSFVLPAVVFSICAWTMKNLPTPYYTLQIHISKCGTISYLSSMFNGQCQMMSRSWYNNGMVISFEQRGEFFVMSYFIGFYWLVEGKKQENIQGQEKSKLGCRFHCMQRFILGSL